MLPAPATVTVRMGVGEYSKEFPGNMPSEEPYVCTNSLQRVCFIFSKS